jgi:hypothetical protein
VAGILIIFFEIFSHKQFKLFGLSELKACVMFTQTSNKLWNKRQMSGIITCDQPIMASKTTLFKFISLSTGASAKGMSLLKLIHIAQMKHKSIRKSKQYLRCLVLSMLKHDTVSIFMDLQPLKGKFISFRSLRDIILLGLFLNGRSFNAFLSGVSSYTFVPVGNKY